MTSASWNGDIAPIFDLRVRVYVLGSDDVEVPTIKLLGFPPVSQFSDETRGLRDRSWV